MIGIGEKIELIRQNKGWSKRELSMKLGIDNQNYNRLVSKGNKMTVEQLGKVANVLGVSLNELLFEKEHIIQKDSEKDQRVRELEKEVQSIKKDFISVINSVLENYLEVILQGFVVRQHMPDLVPMLEDSSKWNNIAEVFNEDKLNLGIQKIKREIKNNQISSEHEILISSLFFPLSSIDIGFYIKEGYIKNIIIINAFKYFEEKILPQYSKF